MLLLCCCLDFDDNLADDCILFDLLEDLLSNIDYLLRFLFSEDLLLLDILDYIIF